MNIKDVIRLLHIKYLRFRGYFTSQIVPEGRIVIVAPHPDDEVIGCGGLIARLISHGNPPHIIIMTGGEGSHNGCCNTSKDDIVNARRHLTRSALDILGMPDNYIHELNFQDGNINGNDTEVESLKLLITDINPQSVFVPHWGEGWPDHINTAKLIRKIINSSSLLTKPQVWEYCVWMWYYNVWRGLDWKNCYKVAMDKEELNLKRKAMDAYISPLAPCGKPWSGVLPTLFINANRGNTELYFKSK